MPITLTTMVELANALRAATAEAERITEQLRQAKEHERTLSEETIPGVMQELGVTTFTLDSGQKVSVKPDVYASIPPDTKDAAMEWLETNGHGGLIKTLVIVEYGKGEFELATELFSELLARNLNVASSQNVHAQTLKAFLREQLAAGKDVPLDLFGARPVLKTTIK